MIKTPNAPHTFDQIVILLLWLSDFLHAGTDSLEQEMDSNLFFSHDEELPNQDYSIYFSKAMMNGFQLWNKESDEFIALQNDSVDKFVCSSLNNKIESVDKLIEKTVQLKERTKELKKLPTTIPNEQYVEKLETEFMKHQTHEQKLCEELKVKQDRLVSVNVLWEEKMKKFHSKEQAVNDLKETIKKQVKNINEYKELAFQITQLKAILSATETEANKLRTNEETIMIERARLLQQSSTAIPLLNEHINRIATIIKNSNVKINPNALASLTINLEGIELKHLHEVNAVFKKIEIKVKEYTNKTQLDVERLKNELVKLTNEKDILVNDLEKLKIKYKKCTSDEQIIDKMLKMKAKKHENFVADMNQKSKENQTKYETLQTEINTSKERIKQIELEIDEKMNQFEKHTMAVIQAKREAIENLQETDKILDQIIESSDIFQDSI